MPTIARPTSSRRILRASALTAALLVIGIGAAHAAAIAAVCAVALFQTTYPLIFLPIVAASRLQFAQRCRIEGHAQRGRCR